MNRWTQYIQQMTEPGAYSLYANTPAGDPRM